LDTAIVVVVPEVERLVEPWRRRFDPAAAEGVAAHITLMFPFRAWAELSEDVHKSLAEIFAKQGPLSLTFRSVRRFPSVLWLAPEPAEPLVDLIHAITGGFPDCLPYGGAHADIVPHLTVAHVPAEGDLDRIDREFGEAASHALPISARIEAATLLRKQDGRWTEQRRYRFAG
jgi:2'-5' RNA ligase